MKIRYVLLIITYLTVKNWRIFKKPHWRWCLITVSYNRICTAVNTSFVLFNAEFGGLDFSLKSNALQIFITSTAPALKFYVIYSTNGWTTYPKICVVNWLFTSFQSMKYLSDQKPFWFQISFGLFLFSTDTDDRFTQFVEATWFFPPQQQVNNKGAPDLAWFNKYSLFGPLCFVYIPARLYLSNALSNFSSKLDCWNYWDVSAPKEVECAGM